MNQTQKRLSIINYAISITDNETIQLQLLKLTMLKADEALQKIIDAIQAENYAQAQRLIAQYIETPTQSVLQRSTQEKKDPLHEEREAIIKEFDLFVVPERELVSQKVHTDEFFTDTQNNQAVPSQSGNYDSLLEIDTDEILKDDTFFEEESAHKLAPAGQEDGMESDSDIFSQNELFRGSKPQTDVHNKPTHYKAIPYLSQKISSMSKQYPSIDTAHNQFESATMLFNKISQKSYTEEEIEEMLTHIKELTEKQHYAEAAQLLLICAATESKFAQFMLARELFKGILFEKNTLESFKHMTNLAAENYPEALCDLGQFYEHGMGAKMDNKKAKQLYFEAMEAGILRAEKHYNRLKEEPKKFLDF